MALADRIQALRHQALEAAFRAETVVRVGRKLGIHKDIKPRSALLLAREALKGKTNPSLIFRFQAENGPERRAIVEVGKTPAEDRSFSYFEVNERLDKLGIALGRRGIGRGAPVLMLVKNRAEFLLIQPAIGRMGGAAVTISWRSTAPEIEFIVKHSGARAIFFDVDIASTVREALSRLGGQLRENAFSVGGEVDGFTSYEELVRSARGEASDASDQAALVMYTSGTTGKPKGAVRKFQKHALPSALAFIGETPLELYEHHLVVCPLYHATAFGFTALSFVLGGTIFVLPEFRGEAFLDAVHRHRITSTAVVPTMLHRLLDVDPAVAKKFDTSSLRVIFSGGAALSAPLAHAFMDRYGEKVWNFYGATETGIVTAASPADLRASPGTIGRRVPGNEIRLVDDSGRVCAPGEVGELYARSSMLVEGYHADADATAASMREGFFSVGDLARVDVRGCYHIEGRKRDMIISGGVNVYPAEVEQTIEAHPGVSEVAVVGAPDPEWGERVRAFVVSKAGTTCDADELKAFCRQRLAGPKVPRDVVFVDALPRNPTGKILKRELRARAI